MSDDIQQKPKQPESTSEQPNQAANLSASVWADASRQRASEQTAKNEPDFRDNSSALTHFEYLGKNQSQAVLNLRREQSGPPEEVVSLNTQRTLATPNGIERGEYMVVRGGKAHLMSARDVASEFVGADDEKSTSSLQRLRERVVAGELAKLRSDNPVRATADVLTSRGTRIDDEFPTRTREQLDAARPTVQNELASWHTLSVYSVSRTFEKTTARLGFNTEEQNQILDGLSSVREHGAKLQSYDGEQIVNWNHTAREFGAALDYAQRNGFDKAQTQNLVFAAMFSDALKTKDNFTTHNTDGALAFQKFAKDRLPDWSQDRIDAVSQAIREHQIAPPEFMAKIYRGKITANLTKDGRQLTESEVTALNDLEAKMAKPLTSETTDATDGPKGAKALRLSELQHEMLRHAGLEDWYVPNKNNSWNAISRALIDVDGTDNYASAGGAGKIVALQGPGKILPLQARHARFSNPEDPKELSAIDSWANSRRSFMGPDDLNESSAKTADTANLVATPETREYLRSQVRSTMRSVDSAAERVDEWIHSPEGRKELGLEPSGSVDIPGWTGDRENPDLLDYKTATPEELARVRTIFDRFSKELVLTQRSGEDLHSYNPLMEQSSAGAGIDFHRTESLRDRASESLPKEAREPGGMRDAFGKAKGVAMPALFLGATAYAAYRAMGAEQHKPTRTDLLPAVSINRDK